MTPKSSSPHPGTIKTLCLSLSSPVGPLALAEADGAIVTLDWGPVADDAETPLLVEARDQLAAYFAGKLCRFDLPLRPHGSRFGQAVWDLMLEIPWGQTRTYGALARALGTAPRAVGGACGRNPIAIIIPCHRVVGGGGWLGGYSGAEGAATKRRLLELEGAGRLTSNIVV
jgi:methylated-DNA-[protein]-cysteine S-methyltransferase